MTTRFSMRGLASPDSRWVYLMSIIMSFRYSFPEQIAHLSRVQMRSSVRTLIIARPPSSRGPCLMAAGVFEECPIFRASTMQWHCCETEQAPPRLTAKAGRTYLMAGKCFVRWKVGMCRCVRLVGCSWIANPPAFIFSTVSCSETFPSWVRLSPCMRLAFDVGRRLIGVSSLSYFSPWIQKSPWIQTMSSGSELCMIRGNGRPCSQSPTVLCSRIWHI